MLKSKMIVHTIGAMKTMNDEVGAEEALQAEMDRALQAIAKENGKIVAFDQSQSAEKAKEGTFVTFVATILYETPA